MVLNVKLIGQGIGGSPSPTCTNLVGCLVCGAHVALVIDLVHGQVAAPCPAALVVVDLSAIGQALDGLNLHEACHIQTITGALVVGTLAVDKAIDGVACKRAVVEHAHILQVIIAEVCAVSVIDGNQRVGTQSSRQYV